MSSLEDMRLGSFVLARAEEDGDPRVQAAVDACFDRIDVSSFHSSRTLPGEISDLAALREIATRWISHPDYPLAFYT